MSVRILLADDHKIIREGLRALLASEPDFQVVADAPNGREAIRLARDHAPHIVVIDIGMPDLNGADAARQILADNPAVRVIALSMHSDNAVVRRMFRAGASGYLLKDCASDELVSAIRAVAAGRMYLSPAIAGVVVRQLTNGQNGLPEPLTSKEREVLQLLAEGKTTKQIAAVLGVSAKTIDTHRQHIMDKLGLHSVAELTKYAIREGLTSLGG